MLSLSDFVLMLKKIYRFSGSKSLQKVKDKGTLIKGNLMMIKFIVDEVDDVKFAVVVSKKISKKAVTRNKISRRIYESVRLYLKNSSIDALNAVIFVSKKILDSTYLEIEEEVHNLIKITQKT